MKHLGVNPSRTIGHIRIVGNGLELACNGGSCGGISLLSLMSFAFDKTPHISLSCMLVPVQYREYDSGFIKLTPSQ